MKDLILRYLKSLKQGDTNKLFGFGELGIVNWQSAHLENSARFGFKSIGFINCGLNAIIYYLKDPLFDPYLILQLLNFRLQDHPFVG